LDRAAECIGEDTKTVAALHQERAKPGGQPMQVEREAVEVGEGIGGSNSWTGKCARAQNRKERTPT
jgi:hypothetical protein